MHPIHHAFLSYAYAIMSCFSVEPTLWSKRRSRCTAGSVATAGKRCAPGQADAGVCGGPASGLRDVSRVARPPRALRRMNKPVRSVCRLWWEAYTDEQLREPHDSSLA